MTIESSSPSPTSPSVSPEPATLRAGLDATKPDHALWIALLDEDEEGVLAALEAGADPNSGAPEAATEKERRERLDWGYQRRGNFIRQGSGWALASAAESLMPNAVQALLDAGADPFLARPMFGRLPIPVQDSGGLAAQSSTPAPSGGSFVANTGALVSQPEPPVDALCCLLSTRHYKGELSAQSATIGRIATALWDNMQQRAARGEVSDDQLYFWHKKEQAERLFVEATWGAALWMARNGVLSLDPAQPGVGFREDLDASNILRSLQRDMEWGKIALWATVDPEVLQLFQPKRQNGGLISSWKNPHREAQQHYFKILSDAAPLSLSSTSPWDVFDHAIGLPHRVRRATFALSAQGIDAMRDELRAIPNSAQNAAFEQVLGHHWSASVAFGHAHWETTQPLLQQTLDWIDSDSSLVEFSVPASGQPSESTARVGVDSSIEMGALWHISRERDRPSPLRRQLAFWQSQALTSSAPRAQWLVEQAMDRMGSGRWSLKPFFDALLLHADRAQNTQWRADRFSGLPIEQLNPLTRARVKRSLSLIHTHRREVAWSKAMREFIAQSIEKDTPTALMWLGPELLPQHVLHTPLVAWATDQEGASTVAKSMDSNTYGQDPTNTGHNPPIGKRTPIRECSMPLNPPDSDARYGLELALRHGSFSCLHFFLENVPQLQTLLLDHPQWLNRVHDSLLANLPLKAHSRAALRKSAFTACDHRLRALKDRAALAEMLGSRDSGRASSENPTSLASMGSLNPRFRSRL